MEMSAHTPGPWTCVVDERRDAVLIFGRNNRDYVGQSGAFGASPTHIANGFLAASSPEMLRVLHECELVFLSYQKMGLGGINDSMLEDIRAVIRQAERGNFTHEDTQTTEAVRESN